MERGRERSEWEGGGEVNAGVRRDGGTTNVGVNNNG